ncbi:hypothetical protein P43SY_009162 [Pythium insidiosum]|uniref:Uncharacterized protein n=1 Tax=Pythium insidiosum TaxID=114742 RepID=A0AAD5LP73_PYTIN|nr:hypothetical protein P43SY_009162 [Pythium insidiosum]
MQQSSTSYMAEQADETTAALGALDSPHAAHLTDPEPVIQSSGADSRGSTADESLVDLDEADGEPVIAPHDDVFGLGSSDEIAMNMGMTLHAMQQLQDELMAHTTPSAETQPLSRRDDKIRQFSEHPIVAGVSPDGRVVHCKCGKAVRLNPPWYILKYEQHLVSRNSKHPVGRHFAVLEQAFSMEDEFARILRELFTAEVEDGSAKNVWFDAADMGIQGLFDSHPAYLGLVEAMMVLKDKERRGVGRQNMSYSEQLDAFMRTLSDVSPEACDFFQHHLGGRKQKYLVGKRRRSAVDDATDAELSLTAQVTGGTVQHHAEADSKKVTFWLRFAKMGLFGFMRSHPVFEGLVASMVEVKDKERRGVGKQNMQYAKALDDFMTALAAVSMDAFELFSLHFCGRTTRSQKVKKRKTDSHSTPQPESAVSVPIEMDQSIAMHSAGVSAEMSLATSSAMALAMTAQAASHVHADTVITVPPHVIQQELSVVEAHHLMSAEDLLGARSLSTADMEESQRLMDRMLGEVNLSVGGATSDALPEAQNEDQATAPSAQDHDQLDAQTYLDENGVLTTML